MQIRNILFYCMYLFFLMRNYYCVTHIGKTFLIIKFANKTAQKLVSCFNLHFFDY